jgi:hypothetical protein
MLHILVGNSSGDPELLFGAVASGKLKMWVVPKTASIGDEVVFYLPSLGFVARGFVQTSPKPHPSWERKYGASVHSLTALSTPVPRDFIRDSITEWGWPHARTLSYTSVSGRIEEQLLELLESYQTSSASPAIPTATQEASDLPQPPAERVATTTYRILRDTELARRVKSIHRFECQICGSTIQLPDGSRYAEAHHIQPLGGSHNGPDVIGNILCLCPNHHAELDYGVTALPLTALRLSDAHPVSPQYVEYHNRKIHKPGKV